MLDRIREDEADGRAALRVLAPGSGALPCAQYRLCWRARVAQCLLTTALSVGHEEGAHHVEGPSTGCRDDGCRGAVHGGRRLSLPKGLAVRRWRRPRARASAITAPDVQSRALADLYRLFLPALMVATMSAPVVLPRGFASWSAGSGKSAMAMAVAPQCIETSASTRAVYRGSTRHGQANSPIAPGGAH